MIIFSVKNKKNFCAVPNIKLLESRKYKNFVFPAFFVVK